MKRTSVLAAALCGLVAIPLAAAEQKSFEELVANLKSPIVKTRVDAVRGLGKSRGRDAITPLSELVRDPEPKVRLELVRTLRELLDLRGVATLVTSLRDGDPQVRGEAVATLVEIYTGKSRTGAVGGFLQIFTDDTDQAPVPPPFADADPAVFRGLAGLLGDQEKGIRQNAAYAIGVLGGSAVAQELVAALQDPEPDVRGAAATAIGRVGGSAEGKALIPLLADSSDDVRRRVLKVIGMLRIKEAGPSLREVYEANRGKDLGLRALDCLARVADPNQADLFKNIIKDEPDPERRRLAIEGLGRVSETSMIPAFTKDYQRERNEDLRLAYSFALTYLGNRAFLDSLVLCLPSKALGKRCRDYIVEMGREILPDLYVYLEDANADVRGSVCEILGEIGDPSAMPHLQPLLSDANSKVVDRATRAVERLKRNAAPAGKRS